MDLSELRPRPVTISLDEITAKNDNHKMQKNEKETGTSKVLHRHIAHWPMKNVSNDTKEGTYFHYISTNTQTNILSTFHLVS